MELAFITSVATLIGFFAGIIVTALTVIRNKRTDNDRYTQMMEHNQTVEVRLGKYVDNSKRIADALEQMIPARNTGPLTDKTDPYNDAMIRTEAEETYALDRERESFCTGAQWMRDLINP